MKPKNRQTLFHMYILHLSLRYVPQSLFVNGKNEFSPPLFTRRDLYIWLITPRVPLFREHILFFSLSLFLFLFFIPLSHSIYIYIIHAIYIYLYSYNKTSLIRTRSLSLSLSLSIYIYISRQQQTFSLYQLLSFCIWNFVQLLSIFSSILLLLLLLTLIFQYKE